MTQVETTEMYAYDPNEERSWGPFGDEVEAEAFIASDKYLSSWCLVKPHPKDTLYPPESYHGRWPLVERASLPPGTKRYRATFSPEAWVRDYAIAVDPEGETSWDCTAFLLEGNAEWRQKVLEDSRTYEGDELRYDPTAPAWVQDWSGPFSIDIEPIEEPEA